MNKILIAFALIALVAAFEPLSQEHVDYINSIQSLWTATQNFEGKTTDDIKYYMGTYLNTPDYLKLPQKEIIPIEGLPESFDSRTAWPNCISIKEIRDQCNCGSCWAFAAATAMSDRICIHSNQTLQTRISTENLIACCGEFTCGNGCQGGYPSGAWSYFAQTGIVTGYMYGSDYGCQDYFLKSCGSSCPQTIASTPTCSNTCRDGYTVSYTDDLKFGKTSYSVPGDEQSMMTEIMTNGPIEAAFTVYTDFMQYKSGVYKHVSGTEEGGHAIRILGWGVDNGTKYWIVANSWSTAWGENGTFRIVKGVNECGIESQPVAGIPQ